MMRRMNDWTDWMSLICAGASILYAIFGRSMDAIYMLGWAIMWELNVLESKRE